MTNLCAKPIDSHFVLIFKVDENNKLIRFEDLQHHDTIYE